MKRFVFPDGHGVFVLASGALLKSVLRATGHSSFMLTRSGASSFDVHRLH